MSDERKAEILEEFGRKLLDGMTEDHDIAQAISNNFWEIYERF